MRAKHPVSTLASKNYEDVRYHVRELAGSGKVLTTLLNNIESSSTESRLLAEALTHLRVALLEHLTYHIREVRRPLAAVERSAYKRPQVQTKGSKARPRRSARKPAVPR